MGRDATRRRKKVVTKPPPDESRCKLEDQRLIREALITVNLVESHEERVRPAFESLKRYADNAYVRTDDGQWWRVWKDGRKDNNGIPTRDYASSPPLRWTRRLRFWLAIKIIPKG